MPIHPTAIIDPGARIAESAEIGPYCIIGAEVEIGPRTRLMANLYIEGPTWIGEDNVFYPFSSVGVASQDRKYKGERAETRIGDRNKIREFVTIHRGTEGGGLLTTIGSDCLLMTYSHVAHDCRIGDQDVMPYSLTSSKPEIGVFGANSIGLGRRGFAPATVEALQTAIRILTRAQLNTSQAIERIQAEVTGCAEVDELVAFIRASERGVIK